MTGICCSVAKSCLILCNHMNCSMLGFPVLHYLLEFAQTHVHWVSDAISSSVVPFSSCLQSFPSSGSLPTSWFFTSGGQSIGASALASVLPVTIEAQLVVIKTTTSSFFWLQVILKTNWLSPWVHIAVIYGQEWQKLDGFLKGDFYQRLALLF